LARSGATDIAATGDPARFEQAHAALRADSSIQFDLPTFAPPKVPAWLRWLSELLEGSGPVFKFVFWGLIALAVLGLLYAVFRWIERGGLAFLRRGRTSAEAEAPAWRPEEAPARALLAEADALAAGGKFDEAVRLLLFRSIEEIEAKRPKLVRPALTSRDIAGADQLPPGPRTAFGRIVMAVERSLFGGRALSEGDWTGCRADYEEFAFAPEWAR